MAERRAASRIRRPGAPGEPVDASWSRNEIDAVIAGLDRATRSFSDRVNSLRDLEAANGATPSLDDPPAPEPRQNGDVPAAADPAQTAELEAKAYLASAKRRVDTLLNAMVGAVEKETEELRRDADRQISERRKHAELEARKHLEEARRVAEAMVAERQQRIARLSDGICARADSLTAGMDDAEEVRRQFDRFVLALSNTARRVAEDWPGGTPAPVPARSEAQSRIAADAGGDPGDAIAA